MKRIISFIKNLFFTKKQVMTIEHFRTVVFASTKEFQKRFDSKSAPNLENRESILNEEVIETLNAINTNNRIDILDGFVDQLYVQGGTCDKFKFDTVIYNMQLQRFNEILNHALLYFSLECLFDAFIEIHNSNMSKTHKNINDVYDSINHYRNVVQNFERVELEGGKYLLYNKDTTKLLKPLTYTKANLKPILEKYGYLK